MKQIIFKILWIMLIVFVLLLIGLSVVGLVLIMRWPWWVSFFIILGLIALYIGFVFLRKLWKRRREQRFVQEIIAQDEASMKKMGEKEKAQALELQERWKEGIQALKKSQLRKQGNPLYVLPWYLILGESGSGKTTAIKSAKLSSPFADVQKSAGISGTRNCDWWFFEQAIILDVAGRYAIPIDEGRDKDEWQQFLRLLTKYRKKEPLNGLIITLPADKALNSAEDELIAEGQSIRARINELMRVLGAKFPIYLMITKCDLIMGMTTFCDSLPEESLKQPMGLVNEDFKTAAETFAVRSVDEVTDRLKELRLLMLNTENGAQEPSLLIFPDEFARLSSGVQAFAKGAFAENPFQETPLLRSVHFSSGRQEGSPFSHFLHSLGLTEAKETLPGTSRGLFLHDFFAKMLPLDRETFMPTQQFLKWKTLTRNLGLTSWIIFILALCGLLSFAFLKNVSTMHGVNKAMEEKPLQRTGDLMTDVFVLDRFRESIVNLEQANANWWIPRFGLDASQDVEEGIKKAYRNQFQEGFLQPFDTVLEQRMTTFSPSTLPGVIAEHVEYLTRRINLIKARLNGDNIQELKQLKQPDYAPLLTAVSTKDASVPEVQDKFRLLYLSYLTWRDDPARMNTEMNRLQAWLERTLDKGGQDLHWLRNWANAQEDISPVFLSEFWKGSLSIEGEPFVPKAFTTEGQKQIELFLKEVEAALKDPLFLASGKLNFKKWYDELVLKAWMEFGQSFSRGRETLAGRNEWQRVVDSLGSEDGPYMKLLNRLEEEFDDFDPEGREPDWLPLLYAFDQAQYYGPDKLATKGKKVLGKVLKKGRRLLKAAEEATEDQARAKIMAGKAYQAYMDAIKEFGSLTASPTTAFEKAASTFAEDEAAGQSPFFKATDAIDDLKTALGHEQAPLFWNWISGPVDVAWRYALNETGCRLQKLWESRVLAEVRGATDRGTINKMLLGQDGFAWQFVKGDAAPFLDRNRAKGYFPRKRYGGTVPFDESFLNYINRGAVQQVVAKDQYRVQITALPVNVNESARYQPHATRLILRCADKDQTLLNLMFPVSETFIWKPASCGDVILEVEVHDAVLSRRYTGDYAFPRFLREFSRGQQRFGPEDFEGSRNVWQRLGMTSIQIQYKLQGHRQPIRLLGGGVPRVPQSIAGCW